MTKQEKVAAFMEQNHFTKGPFTPNGQVWTHPSFQFGEFISDTQATFFYEVAEEAELKAEAALENIKDWTHRGLEDPNTAYRCLQMVDHDLRHLKQKGQSDE